MTDRTSTPGHLRQHLAQLAVACGGALIAWYFTLYTLILGGFALDYGITPYAAPVSLLAIPLWALACREDGGPTSVLTLPLVLSVTLLLLYGAYEVAARFYDLSWDGMAYHQEAILRLLEGWNPLTDRLPNAAPYATQIQSYPKAPWLVAAAVQRIDGHLEAGKGLHFVLAAGAFLLLAGALLKLRALPAWASGLLALAAASSPVVIYQSLSFYVDGLVGSLFTSMVALIILLVPRPGWRLLGLFCAVLVLMINTKQTGILYAALGSATLLGMLWKSGGPWKGGLAAGLLSGMIGVGLFGYSPYVTNALEHGNPLYPIFGSRADFEQGHRPPEFDGMSGPERLLRSTFSRPTVAPNAAPHLKIPLSTEDAEIQKFQGADIRLGGWGVLFSGGLALASVGLLFIPGVPRGYRGGGLALLVGVALSVLLNPEAWWARFAPQWFLVPLITGGLLLGSQKSLIRAVGLSTVGILIVNNGLVAYSYYPFQAMNTTLQRDQLNGIARARVPIVVDFGAFPSNRVRLEEAGIAYVDSPGRLPCRNPRPIFAYEGEFCFRGEP